MRTLRPIAVLWLLALLATRVSAQSPSGPEVGAKPPSLKAIVAVGDGAGETVDLAKARAGKPTVYLFVRADKWDRLTARYVKNIDSHLDKSVPDGEIVAVWLTDEVDKSKEYLPVAQTSLKFERAILAVYPGPKTGPTDWMINDAAHVTTVVVRDGKVAARFGLVSVGTSDFDDVVKVLGKEK